MSQNEPDYFLRPYISFKHSEKNLSIEIETKRLYLLSYRDAHFEDCVALYGCQLITKYFDHGRPRSRNEVKQLVYEKGTKYFSCGQPFGLFSIYEKKSKSFLGQIDLLPTCECGTLEIGFILHAKHQGQGFCTEAARTLVNEYLEELDYRKICCRSSTLKIIATVHPENQASRKVLQKIGMVFEKNEDRFNQPRSWFSMPSSISETYKRKKTITNEK